MQRSITNKNYLGLFTYIIFFVIYQSLSSIYLFLPPLLGVLFYLFSISLKDDDTVNSFFIILCLLIFEADKGYPIFSSILYFLIIYKFVLPIIIKNFSCYSCIRLSYVFLAYIGFFIFNLSISYVFMYTLPNFNYYIIYYIVIEFLIVSAL